MNGFLLVPVFSNGPPVAAIDGFQILPKAVFRSRNLRTLMNSVSAVINGCDFLPDAAC